MKVFFLSNIISIFVMLYNVFNMILRTVSSKNTTLYYVQKSFRQENGKNATKYVERLGNIEQLKARRRNMSRNSRGQKRRHGNPS